MQNSLLEHYRRFLQFRRECRPLIKGSLQSIEARDDVLHFVREFGNETVVCLFNFSKQPIQYDIQTDRTAVMLHGHGFDATLQERTLFLPAAGAAYLRLE